MTLTQSGNQVSGSYTHDSGKLTGTVSGNTLIGWWSEAPSYSPPKDAGAVELTLAANGQSFSGRWRYGNSGSWYEKGWTGTRMGQQPQPKPQPTISHDWGGDWTTDWGLMKLSQTGNKVTGTYEYNDGEIEGTVKGSVLAGTWSKSPSYTKPKDAGTFQFTLSTDAKSFTGDWRYGDCDWNGDWDGDIIEPDVTPQPAPGTNQPPTASFYTTPPFPRQAIPS